MEGSLGEDYNAIASVSFYFKEFYICIYVFFLNTNDPHRNI